MRYATGGARRSGETAYRSPAPADKRAYTKPDVFALGRHYYIESDIAPFGAKHKRAMLTLDREREHLASLPKPPKPRAEGREVWFMIAIGVGFILAAIIEILHR